MSSDTKYPSLNGLRALSIVLVVTHHLNIIEHVFDDLYQYTWLCPLIEFMQDGQLGVNVFFVISGFLITSLMTREEAETQSVSLKNFYIRRTLRIFPAYYFLLLVYFVLQLSRFLHLSSASWITSLTYTKYFNWPLDWYTAHGWSLSIEEHFYILWPLVFTLGRRFRKVLAITLVIFVPFVRIYTHFNEVTWINEMTIFTRIDAIATGCLCALYKDMIFAAMSKHWRLFFYPALLSLFFLRYFPRLGGSLDLSYVFITHGTIANMLIVVIMMYSVFGPQRLWFKILNLKAISYIGVLSYSIYLWQQIFISGGGHWFTKFPQNLGLILATAMLSYYLIEKPFLILKTKFHKDIKQNAK